MQDYDTPQVLLIIPGTEVHSNVGATHTGLEGSGITRGQGSRRVPGQFREVADTFIRRLESDGLSGYLPAPYSDSSWYV